MLDIAALVRRVTRSRGAVCPLMIKRYWNGFGRALGADPPQRESVDNRRRKL